MNQIKIIKASPDDFKVIRKIGQQTFLESFASSTTEADMAKYLEESFTEKKISAELANPDSMFFIALDNEILWAT